MTGGPSTKANADADARTDTNTRAGSALLGRLLALDVGAKRVGVAVSDPLGLSARALVTLANSGVPRIASAVAGLAKEWGVVGIVVGLPLYPSGDEAEGAPLARELAGAVHGATGLPVIMWDESGTTQTAQARRPASRRPASAESRRRLDAAGPGLDAEAAAVILEEWLAAHAGNARQVLAAAAAAAARR